MGRTGRTQRNSEAQHLIKMEKLFVVKIGGQVIDKDDHLRRFLSDFAAVSGPKILVHGGGAIATRLGEKLGITSHYVKGRRITDRETLDLVTMVYGGLVNKQIVAGLQKAGNNAMGLTGADGALIRATRRTGAEVDFGFVGDLNRDSVNTELLQKLLHAGVTPVIAPLTLGDGTMLNTNADTIASSLAVALSGRYAVRLMYCFEKQGVLKDVNDPGSVIRRLDRTSYQAGLTEGIFHDGILPKLENAFTAIQAGVREVLIGDAADLLHNTGEETSGTLITE